MFWAREGGGGSLRLVHVRHRLHRHVVSMQIFGQLQTCRHGVALPSSRYFLRSARRKATCQPPPDVTGPRSHVWPVVEDGGLLDRKSDVYTQLERLSSDNSSCLSTDHVVCHLNRSCSCRPRIRPPPQWSLAVVTCVATQIKLMFAADQWRMGALSHASRTPTAFGGPVSRRFGSGSAVRDVAMSLHGFPDATVSKSISRCAWLPANKCLQSCRHRSCRASDGNCTGALQGQL